MMRMNRFALLSVAGACGFCSVYNLEEPKQEASVFSNIKDSLLKARRGVVLRAKQIEQYSTGFYESEEYRMAHEASREVVRAGLVVGDLTNSLEKTARENQVLAFSTVLSVVLFRLVPTWRLRTGVVALLGTSWLVFAPDAVSSATKSTMRFGAKVLERVGL